MDDSEMFPIDPICSRGPIDRAGRCLHCTDEPLAKKSTKPDLWLLPGDALKRAAVVAMRGNEKYDEGSWKTVPVRDLVSAALRHLTSYADGEELDDETGLCHLDHALASLLFAVSNEGRRVTKAE